MPAPSSCLRNDSTASIVGLTTVLLLSESSQISLRMTRWSSRSTTFGSSFVHHLGGRYLVWWQHGLIYTTDAIGLSSGLWLATWFFQVMPIFFFVGGFSNMVSYDAARQRGDSTWAFVRTCEWRLLRPSLVFLGVWTVVQV